MQGIMVNYQDLPDFFTDVILPEHFRNLPNDQLVGKMKGVSQIHATVCCFLQHLHHVISMISGQRSREDLGDRLRKIQGDAVRSRTCRHHDTGVRY